MAKASFRKDEEGRSIIKVTEITPIGITRFIPGRVYHVDDQTLAQLGSKAQPADE